MHLLRSLIIQVAKGCHLLLPITLIKMPAPSTGLLLAGRSQRQAGSPKNPVKDLQKHFKVDPAEPVMLMFSAERDATHKRSVQS